MKRIAAALLALALVFSQAVPLSASKKKRSSSKEKIQQVSGYTTKKGKKVKPYKRRPPN